MTAESTGGNTTTSASSNATEELYHTNLLRLQAKQLLSESMLSLSAQTGLLENEVKWSKDVIEYIDTVQKTIQSMDAAILSPDSVLLKNKGELNKNSSSNKNKGGKDKEQDTSVSSSSPSFSIQLHSDKAKKHFQSNQKTTKQNQKDQEWNFHFPGGEYLQMTNINSYAANGAGLTVTNANANVIPTIDLAVLMPVKSRREEDYDPDDIASGMIGGKDYLNGRYFDVRFCC